MVVVSALFFSFCAHRLTDGVLMLPQISCQSQFNFHAISCEAPEDPRVNIVWSVTDYQGKDYFFNYGSKVTLSIPDKGSSVVEATFCVHNQGCPTSLKFRAIRLHDRIALTKDE